MTSDADALGVVVPPPLAWRPAISSPCWAHAVLVSSLLSVLRPNHCGGRGPAFEMTRALAVACGLPATFDDLTDGAVSRIDLMVLEVNDAEMLDEARSRAAWAGTLLIVHGAPADVAARGPERVRWFPEAAGLALFADQPGRPEAFWALGGPEAQAFAAHCAAIGERWLVDQRLAEAEAEIASLRRTVGRLERELALARAALRPDRIEPLPPPAAAVAPELPRGVRSYLRARRRALVRRACSIVLPVTTGEVHDRLARYRDGLRKRRDPASLPAAPGPAAPEPAAPSTRVRTHEERLGRHLGLTTLFPVTIGIVVPMGFSEDRLRQVVATATDELRSIGQAAPGRILLLGLTDRIDPTALSQWPVVVVPAPRGAQSAAAHNRLMQSAFDGGAEIYLALSAEGLLRPGALGAMVRMMRAADLLALVGPRDDDAASAGRLDVEWLSGRCLAIPRKIHAAIGGFDTRFASHGADIDFAWRARAHGFQALACPDATFRAEDHPAEPEASLAATYRLARKWGVTAVAETAARQLAAQGYPVPDMPNAAEGEAPAVARFTFDAPGLRRPW